MSKPINAATPGDPAATESAADFVHEIRVAWGDCDPARIAYTGRLPWFALDAINAWWEHYLDGVGWYQMEQDRDLCTPFVHMSMNFKKPVTPRHRLHCRVRPVKLGETSVEFLVGGYQNGALCFDGRFVCVFAIASSFSKRRPPEDIHALLQPLIRPE